MRTILFILLNLLSSLMLVSCVGTVATTEEAVTQGKDFKEYGIYFEGVKKAFGISHNKVNLSFKAATGGSGIFTYVVYKDGNYVTPVASIPAIAASIDSEGMINITASNLNIGTIYAFTVRAYDMINAVEDTNTVVKSAATLDYEVPVFDGVVAVENTAGMAGETSLKVRWNPATVTSSNPDPFGSNPFAVGGYNISYGTSSDDLSMVATTAASATEIVLTNLDSDKEYYVRVRARNSQTPAREDQNVKIIKAKTLRPEPINFSGIKTLSIPTSNSGYSTLSLSWNKGSGSFDRYRIFVSTTARSVFDPTSDVLTMDITDLNATAVNVTSGITANTTYYVAVVACKVGASVSVCDKFAGNNVVKNVRTSPPVASFNGLSALTQPSDETGLTSVVASWALPDTTMGVYNQIKIFKTSPSGTFDPLVDELQTSSAIPGVPYIDSSTATSTSVVIRGMSTGTEYCFVAKAYATVPADPANPGGRASMGSKKLCVTPLYSMPGFAGIKSGCTGQTPNTFTVSWDLPSPMGIFEKYILFYKHDNGVPFDFEAAISGAPGYQRLEIAKNKVNYTVSSLSPNTRYKIGIKTYFNNTGDPAQAKWDPNVMLTECTTKNIQATHLGWTNVIALGPKVNGLTNTIVREKLSIDRGASVYKHPYPIEFQAGTPGTNSSEKGMVYLRWHDFDLVGDSNKLNYYNSAGANNGYEVYRRDFIDPTHYTNPDIDSGNPLNLSGWQKVSGATLVQGQAWTNPATGLSEPFAEFVDYSVNNTDSEKTKTYWYKVIPVLSGQPVPLDSTPPDYLIKVVLPPKNMALAHRWITNLTMCKKLGRPHDRARNYACDYNGITRVKEKGLNYYLANDPSNIKTPGKFYDMKHDLIINRFELGCNFSRGTTPKMCSPHATLNFNWYGNSSAPAASPENAAQGFVQGDCVGEGNPDGRIIAQRDAVYFNHQNYTCFINNSTVSGNSWKSLADLDPGETDNSSSVFPVSYGPYAGQGRGAFIGSNNANLPILMRSNWDDLFHVCAGTVVRHNEIKNASKLWPKRFLRRKEWMAAMAWDDQTIQRVDLEKGNISTPLDNDCNSYNQKPELTTFSLTDFRWPFTKLSGGFINSDAKRALATGSSGSFSSEACVSRFGIQDAIGNAKESLSEEFHCYGNDAYGVPRRYCATKIDQLGDGSPTPRASKALDPGAYEVNSFDDGGVEKYLDITFSSTDTEKHGYAFLFNGRIRDNANTVNFARFLNPTIGLMMMCGSPNGSTLCDSARDDNVLVSPYSPDHFETKIKNFEVNHSTQSFSISNVNATTGTSKVMQVGGQHGEGAYDMIGFYQTQMEYSVSDGFSSYNGSIGARCGVLLDE